MSEGSMKQMAELLRKGATMLNESCPDCNTPLFKLRDGSLICPMCNKPVVYVSADADTEGMAQQGSIDQTLMNKVKEIQGMLEKEKAPSKLNALLETLMKLLDARERVRKIG
ncbi:MAG: Sjogren's syndrome/scleroderma autoantigen 1 family protein [Candidatus Bathyarchaeota archaeon]